MDNYDFTIEVYCNKKDILTASKTGNPNEEDFELINIVRTPISGNYLVLVDTNTIGTGTIKCKITAEIPDNDFEDGYRTEVVILDTEIEIIKNL